MGYTLDMEKISLDQARNAKPLAKKLFSRVADVNGVGITQVKQGYAVKVNLSSPPAKGVVLPSEVDGVPIQVEVVGTIAKRGIA
jgi:hypothetical protein